MTKRWEADSGIKPESDVIIFSFLKEEHSGDSLNPCKEKIQSRRGSEAVSCLSPSSVCNYLLSLITWTNAISITVFPSRQSHFAEHEVYQGSASKGIEGKHPSLVLEQPWWGNTLGPPRDQAQGGLAGGGVESQRAVWEPQGHGTMPEVFKQGPTMEMKSSVPRGERRSSRSPSGQVAVYCLYCPSLCSQTYAGMHTQGPS